VQIKHKQVFRLEDSTSVAAVLLFSSTLLQFEVERQKSVMTIDFQNFMDQSGIRGKRTHDFLRDL